MYLHFYWHIPFVGNRYYNWFTYLIKKSTGILRLFWSLKLFCWVGFNLRWGCIYLMIALDWGSIRNLRGWGCIQEWGSIQADTVTNFKRLWKVNSRAFSNQTFFRVFQNIEITEISWKTCARCWHLERADKNVKKLMIKR